MWICEKSAKKFENVDLTCIVIACRTNHIIRIKLWSKNRDIRDITEVKHNKTRENNHNKKTKMTSTKTTYRTKANVDV